MEQWEKEYEDIVTQQHKEKRRGRALAHFSGSSSPKRKGSAKAALAVAIVAICVVVGISALHYNTPTIPGFTSQISSGSNVAGINSVSSSSSTGSNQSTDSATSGSPGTGNGAAASNSAAAAASSKKLDPNQTYIDGTKFNEMMLFLKESDQIISDIYTAANDTSWNIAAEDLVKFKEEIDSWKSELNTLQYHKSYQNYAQACANTIATAEGFLTALQNGADADAINAYINALNELNSDKKTAMIDAFDANGVSYEQTDNGISYRYYPDY